MPKIEKYLEYPQDTRWATDDEIMSPLSSVKLDISAPPFKTAGLILKSDGKTVYVDGQDHHSMILGSTGSGKSRLLCMPMIGIMANAGESFIATDPKGELFYMTSGVARAQGYQVVVLNFRDVSRGDMWNPLSIPYELYQKGDKDYAMSLLNDFVMSLAAADCTGEQFWSQMAQSLILANILLLFETGKREEINMYSLSRLCLDYGQPKRQNAIYQLQRYMNPDSIAAMNYAGVCVDAEKTQSSIMSVVHSILRVFNTQEGLLRMMSDNTFDMRSFGRKKTAVYLIVPDEKRTFHFLVSTFIKQCYEMLIGEAHKEADLKLPVRVNFVLDEFANLPAIPDMPSMISAARSRNIRFHLVIQSMSQLSGKYGCDAETISSNCENWVYLNSREYDCLEEISRRCGNLVDNRDQLRPLITPARLQRLDKSRGESLIFHGRHYPYISYLADISRYSFPVCEPVELKVGKWSPAAVFHVHEILQQLKSGKRYPLFYRESSGLHRSQLQETRLENVHGNFYENSYGSLQENADGNLYGKVCQEPVVPDFLRKNDKKFLDGNQNLREEELLSRLYRERMELAKGGNPDHLLYYLLGTQEEMKFIQNKILSDEVIHERLADRLEAENGYRYSVLAACCAVLAATAQNQDKTEFYVNWLMGIYTDTVSCLSDTGQILLFYPASAASQDAVILAGLAFSCRNILRGRYAAAKRILGFINVYRDFFYRYPGLGVLLQDLMQFLQALYDGAEKIRVLNCLQELKKPVSFQKAEESNLDWYRKKQESGQDKQMRLCVLGFCQAEFEYFQKQMEELHV